METFNHRLYMLIWILSRFAIKKPKRKVWDLLTSFVVLCVLGGLFVLTSCGGGRYYNDGYYDGGYYDDGYYYNRGHGYRDGHDDHDGHRGGGGEQRSGQGGGQGGGSGGHAGGGGGGHR